MDNRALGYVRVSTEEQGSQGLSIPAQRAAIDAYCRMRGLDLVDIIEDVGISASKPLGTRPGGKKLLELLAGRRASHVVVVRLDRAFRSASDCLTNVEAWTKKGIVLHLLDVAGNTIDTCSPSGKFMLTILAAVAEMERSLIAERTRNVLRWKRENGEVYGPEPWGYRREGKRLVPAEDELRVLGIVKELRRAGASLRQICRELEAAGIPTKRGGRWAPETIAKMLARA